MCNKLHLGSHKEIPAEGKGYKVFTIKEGRLLPMFHHGRFTINTWHEWDTEEDWGSGFCFFLDYAEAKRCLMDCVDDADGDTAFAKEECKRRVTEWVIFPIEYRQGLGSCLEDNIVGQKKYRVALAKEIKPVLK